MEFFLGILGFILFILLACIIMVAINVLFDFFSVVVIILAALLLIFGMIFGFGVALVNTIKVYHDVFQNRQRGA